MDTSAKSILRPIIIIAGFVLIIAGMRAAASIVNIVLIAYVVVLLVAPIQRWLTNRHVPSIVAILLILLLLIGILLLIGWFTILSLRQLEQDLPQYQQQLENTMEVMINWLSSLGIDTSQLIIPGAISFSSIGQVLLSAVGRVVSGLANIFTTVGLILAILFFALLEIKDVPARLFHAFVGHEHILGSISSMNDGLRRYILLKAATGLLMAIANTTLLLIVGVEFAFLWGLLTFFMNFIPNVGFFISLIPPVILAYLQFGFGSSLLVFIGYLLINTVVNTLITPRIMGRGLDLSPTIIFIALLFWAWVLGATGVFMAVPLLIMLKILSDQFDDTRWLATAISEKAPK